MKKCKVEILGIDLPCNRPAGRHALKIMSKRIGNKGKFKIPLCKRHYETLLEQGRVEDLITREIVDGGNSKEYGATLT